MQVLGPLLGDGDDIITEVTVNGIVQTFFSGMAKGKPPFNRNSVAPPNFTAKAKCSGAWEKGYSTSCRERGEIKLGRHIC